MPYALASIASAPMASVREVGSVALGLPNMYVGSPSCSRAHSSRIGFWSAGDAPGMGR